MAVIKYFPRPYRIAGHRGSIVFTANFSGNIVRNRKMPLRRSTPRTQTIRSKFTTMSQRWRLLTPAEQLTFYTKAPQYLKVYDNGKIKHPPGPSLQIEMNIPLSVNSDPLVNTLDDKLVFPSRNYAFGILTASPFDFVVFLNDNTIPSDYAFKFYCSGRRSVSPSLSFPSDYELIETFNSTPPFSYPLTSNYVAIFGPGPGTVPPLPQGIYIGVVLVGLNISTGQQQILDSFVVSSI